MTDAVGYTRYPTRRGAAVKARAQTVFTDYRKKARNEDHKYNGTAAGAVGPIEERLQQFGVVVFMVCTR
jgi:hypothetical protein